MARRRHAEKREVLPDPRYSSVQVTRFINCIMRRGKKSTAERTFYGAFDMIGERVKDAEPLEVFLRALENLKPVLEVKSRRVGGANYQVPIEVRPERRASLAIRWLIESSRSRPEKTMRERLAFELIDAYNNTGIAIKKKEETHRMAEANRAFAHYRW
jgi:small subunit ribosomal protein S7